MARTKDKVSGWEYGLGWCSFIPVIGIFLGVAAIVAGAIKLKAGGAKLIALALAGVLAGTVGLYYFTHLAYSGLTRSYMPGIYQSLSKQYLKQTVMALEYYKLVHGAYPATLDELKGDGTHFLHDPSQGNNFQKIELQHAYRLQPGGKRYLLMDTGPDGLTGTADDVFPVLGPEELARTGYQKPAWQP
jgi:hypothetical protein